MSVRWITPTLGTASWEEGVLASWDAIVDVRSLRDAGGNSPALLAQKIAEIEAHVRAGRRTVVCCDHGKSRSNAIAAAALARIDGGGLDAALGRVLRATGERAIKIEVLADLRTILGETGLEGAPQDDAAALVISTDEFIAHAFDAVFPRSARVMEVADAKVALANPVVLQEVARSSGSRCLVWMARPAVLDSNEGVGELLATLRGAIDVCRACGLHLVFLSGYQVYSGYRGAELHADEDTPKRPAGALGDALWLAEQLIELYSERDGLASLVVRTGAIYGQGDTRPGFLRTFVQRALRGDEIITHRYRNGLPIVELLHVRDLAGAMAAAVCKRLTGRLHLGPGEGITTLALAQTVVRLAGSKSVVRCVDLNGDAAHVTLDASRAIASLQWAPEITLEAGISELISNFRSVDQRKEVKQP